MTCIDDMLVVAVSKQVVRNPTLGLIYLLENLGLIIHPGKTVITPTQPIEFLEMQVHQRLMELHLPGQKIKKLRTGAMKVLNQVPVGPLTAQVVLRLLGKLNAVLQAVTPARCFAALSREI